LTNSTLASKIKIFLVNPPKKASLVKHQLLESLAPVCKQFSEQPIAETVTVEEAAIPKSQSSPLPIKPLPQ
jgi:hypothetical protein